MQRKLTDKEIALAKTAQKSLGDGFFWLNTPDGHDYWRGVSDRLLRMIKHETNDGKPWVEPEKVANEDEYGRIRDLAIDAAVHRLIMVRNPTLTVIEVQRRCRTECVSGSCEYTIFFDNNLVAKIDLISQRRFAIEIQEPKEKRDAR